MLYDPKWKPTTKTDKPTLVGFISWLEAQEPRERYDFLEPDKCAWAQYTGRCDGMVPQPFDGIVSPTPWTFGSALRRARKISGK